MSGAITMTITAASRLLLLDLEGVLIPEWGDWHCPVHSIRQLRDKIRDFAPDHIQLFTYAAHSEEDEHVLRTQLPMLSVALAHPILDFWPLTDVRQALRDAASIHVNSNMDLVRHHTKEEVLFYLFQAGKLPSHTLLIDDHITTQHWRIDGPPPRTITLQHFSL
jgi:hypothetical protein